MSISQQAYICVCVCLSSVQLTPFIRSFFRTLGGNKKCNFVTGLEILHAAAARNTVSSCIEVYSTRAREIFRDKVNLILGKNPY